MEPLNSKNLRNINFAFYFNKLFFGILNVIIFHEIILKVQGFLPLAPFPSSPFSLTSHNFSHNTTAFQQQSQIHHLRLKCIITWKVLPMVENLTSYCQSLCNSFIRSPPFILEQRCLLQLAYTSQYANLNYTVPLGQCVCVCVYIYLCIFVFCFCIKLALYQREHSIFVLLGLTYFTLLQLEPFCFTWQNLMLFNG